MKRAFALQLQSRAAQIFGVAEASIFAGARFEEVKAVEEAIAYVCWITGETPLAMGKNFGAYDFHAAMKRCCKRRAEDRAYSDKVGELVLAAQIGFGKARAEEVAA